MQTDQQLDAIRTVLDAILDKMDKILDKTDGIIAKFDSISDLCDIMGEKLDDNTKQVTEQLDTIQRITLFNNK